MKAAYVLLSLVIWARLGSARRALAGGDRRPGSPLRPDWTLMLALHNTFRLYHGAPSLQWSEALATKAQRWTDRCEWKHSSWAERDESAGENMYYSFGDRWNGSSLVIDAMSAFYEEAEYYNFQQPGHMPLDRTDGKKVGHLTQILWAATTHIGCGFTACRELALSGVTSTEHQLNFIVCRYSPSGNWHGEFTSQVRPFDSARLRMENSRRAQLVPNVVKAG